MYKEAKVLKIHSLFTEQKEAIGSKSDEVVSNLEKLNDYISDFKMSVLRSTIEVALALIEKSTGQKIFYSEFLFTRISEILKGAFLIDKISIYLNSEDENLLRLFHSERIDELHQLKIEPDENLSRGECHFDYEFSEIKSRVIQRSIDIKSLLSEHYKRNLIKFPNSSPEKTPDENSLKIPVTQNMKIFFELEKIAPEELSQLLQIENPKIIAYILINLKPEKSKNIFLLFNKTLQYKVIENLLTINRIPLKLIQSIGVAAVSLLTNHNDNLNFSNRII